MRLRARARSVSNVPGGTMRTFLAIVLLLLIAPAHADDKSAIVGTWKLVSVVYEDAQTKERTPVLGEHPRGFQIATPEGRWLALVTADGRPIPKTDEERAQALRTMIAYTGRYRIEDGKVITKVDAAWNEAWVGGEQVRFIRFEGNDLLHIESPPMPHPNVNNKVVRVIVTWERDKS
jgi:Lipocalin-like domain